MEQGTYQRILNSMLEAAFNPLLCTLTFLPEFPLQLQAPQSAVRTPGQRAQSSSAGKCSSY